MATIDPRRPLWYRRYRGAAYLCAFAALVWTAAIVLPFEPFSYLPPIIVGPGPSTWLVLAYVLFLVVGIGGFGSLSAFLSTVELHENRTVDSRIMWPALVLLSVGFVGSVLLLAVAGAVGGYDSYLGFTANSIDQVLSPYVFPITGMVLITIIGAALAVLSMVRARWPSS
ncbi:MAG: hypothetical protein JRM80_00220 [Nitrososphaerota archaeon]|nr:hypothetical protein [Nitrososphaerota archaeon]